MKFVWGALISFLPTRYRSRSSLEGSRLLVQAATFCGICQTILFSFAFIAAFISESTGIWEQASGVVLNAERGPTMDPLQVRLTTGVLGVTNFLLQPLHAFYGYMAVEGAVRAFSPFAFGHILPNLMLWLVSAPHNLVESRKIKRKSAVLLKDVIKAARDDTYDLHVLSYLAKDWNPYIGIQFRGELYLLIGEEREQGLRPFAYRLRKNPEGNLVVVVRNYTPELGSER